MHNLVMQVFPETEEPARAPRNLERHIGARLGVSFQLTKEAPQSKIAFCLISERRLSERLSPNLKANLGPVILQRG